MPMIQLLLKSEESALNMPHSSTETFTRCARIFVAESASRGVFTSRFHPGVSRPSILLMLRRKMQLWLRQGKRIEKMISQTAV